MASDHGKFRTNDLERLADSLFTPRLEALGFSRAAIERDSWGTSLIYTSVEIGLRVEVDWRDTAVCVLLVRMLNGRLPGGYYMFEGKRVRAHLEEVLGLSQPSKREKGSERVRNEEDLAAQLRRYVAIIEAEGTDLIQKGSAFFANDSGASVSLP